MIVPAIRAPAPDRWLALAVPKCVPVCAVSSVDPRSLHLLGQSPRFGISAARHGRGSSAHSVLWVEEILSRRAAKRAATAPSREFQRVQSKKKAKSAHQHRREMHRRSVRRRVEAPRIDHLGRRIGSKKEPLRLQIIRDALQRASGRTMSKQSRDAFGRIGSRAGLLHIVCRLLKPTVRGEARHCIAHLKQYSFARRGPVHRKRVAPRGSKLDLTGARASAR